MERVVRTAFSIFNRQFAASRRIGPTRGITRVVRVRHEQEKAVFVVPKRDVFAAVGPTFGEHAEAELVAEAAWLGERQDLRRELACSLTGLDQNADRTFDHQLRARYPVF